MAVFQVAFNAGGQMNERSRLIISKLLIWPCLAKHTLQNTSLFSFALGKLRFFM
jgi:hypothetical protein